MKVSDKLQCSLPSWYPLFEKVTFHTVIIPLPKDVHDYLMEDGELVLPKECNTESYDGKEDDYEEYGDVDWNEDSENDELDQKSFPEFSKRIQSVLKKFGGEAFIKLNWSSPKDATWVAFNNNLKVTNLSQIYLLLKSSDFVSHDLTMPFSLCSDFGNTQICLDYSLVMRKWVDVNPGTEFRCWVADGCLVALCQRDVTNFYPHMAREEKSIEQDLTTFFREQIRDKFPLDLYVIDVVRLRKDKVMLVDFNPWCNNTDGLLFDWSELNDLQSAKNEASFRYIKESSGVQPHPYRHYSIPRDMVDLASGTDPYKLMDFLKLKEETENGEDDSDQD